MRRLLLAMLLACCTGAQAQPDHQALTGELEALHRRAGFTGFAVASVTKDGVAYRHGFGYADIKAKRPYRTDTVQNVGSVSKTVVGVALAKAVELGYFTLDTEINAVLPFRVDNPHPGAGPITIRHLVTHTSGIVDDDEVYGHSYYLNAYSDRRSPLLKRFVREFTVPGRSDTSLDGFLKNYLAAEGRTFKASNFGKAPSGSSYAYSNIGAALAAYLIELRSGQRFDAFCRTHIFQPLGMRHTSWAIDDALAAPCAPVRHREAGVSAVFAHYLSGRRLDQFGRRPGDLPGGNDQGLSGRVRLAGQGIVQAAVRQAVRGRCDSGRQSEKRTERRPVLAPFGQRADRPFGQRSGREHLHGVRPGDGDRKAVLDEQRHGWRGRGSFCTPDAAIRADLVRAGAATMNAATTPRMRTAGFG
nr:serine hydrolase domain-containing protein [Massilia mucilaginosa]